MTKDRHAAETIALKALGFLAADPHAIERFLRAGGLAAGDLRARAGDAELLAAVVDYLLADDATLAAFCEAESLEPREVHLARRALPGG